MGSLLVYGSLEIERRTVRKAFQHVAQGDVVETPFDGSILADLKKVWTFCAQSLGG